MPEHIRVAHLADEKNPKITVCGEPWENWQHPDQGATDDEVIRIFFEDPKRAHLDEATRMKLAQRELVKIKDEERVRKEHKARLPVRQCQGCMRIALLLESRKKTKAHTR